MEIGIEYEIESRNAVIISSDIGSEWISIIRACQDYTETSLISPDSLTITLPWWSFLLAKDAIGYHLAKSGASVVISESATAQLQLANERLQAYNSVSTTKSIDESELKQKLTSAGFVRELTKEQLNNVLKIGHLPAAATFSVPGAGKTTEALAYYCCRRTAASKLLIVCPKNAFAVWEEQIQLIFPKKNIKVRRLTGGINSVAAILHEAPDVLTISYHQLATAQQAIGDFLSTHQVVMFLDESHKMKRGDEGKIGAMILSLAHLPYSKCIMSGTPLPNAISDLIPQFKFLYPEISADSENVRSLIKPIFVRTTKKQLDIPGITRKKIDIDLTAPQRALYQLMCSEIARENYSGLSAVDRRKLRTLGKSAIRLLQLTSNPSLLASKTDFEFQPILAALLEEGDSPKINHAINRARELAYQGKKVIIWSSFVKNVELISSRLNDIGAEFIHGQVEVGDDEENTREWKIKKFHEDPKCMVLVANPAACAEGISLHTVCHHAIYLDRNYNAAQYLQSEDRIHRLGLSNTQVTTVEILCCRNTIDESVGIRLQKKVKLMGEVLDDPELNIDPIPLDIDDGLEFDLEDAKNFLDHINSSFFE